MVVGHWNHAGTKRTFYRPVATYRAGTAMATFMGELELVNMLVNMQKLVGVVVITTQYGRTTFKLLATVLF